MKALKPYFRSLPPSFHSYPHSPSFHSYPRPAVSEKRLSVTSTGKVRYELKTPYRNGTTHVIFEPIDFIARLAALVPKPRVNLTRYHGVFAPNNKYRLHLTPAKRGKGYKAQTDKAGKDKTSTERHVAMTWMQRLKRGHQSL